MQIGRTERIKNNLNPNFEQAINADYYFEELQTVRFSVFAAARFNTKVISHAHL